MSVKRVDRVGPVIDFSTPSQAIRDIRRAASTCPECGGELTVDGACVKRARIERRDKNKDNA